MMEIYYHVTPRRNLQNIKKTGLVPQVGERSALLGEDSGIFLFGDLDAMETALMQWLGDAFDEDEDLVVLEIALPDGFPVEETPNAGFESSTSEVIPPEYITVTDIQA
jgi:hypothetical protein